MYLNKLPKFDYNFNEGDDGAIKLQVTDLFRRVAFTEETRKDLRNFIEYIVEDGERPDDVAFKIYGDPKWFWIVLMSNNIVDVEAEWPMSQNKIQRRFLNDGFLNGSSIFVEENRDFRRGDFIVKGSACTVEQGCPDGVTGVEGNYARIESFDRELMKININREGPSFSLDDGDTVFAVRKIQGQDGFSFPFVQAATGCGFGSTSFTAKRVTTIPTGVAKFKYGTWNISPYTTATGGTVPGGPPNATTVPHTTINNNKGLCSDVVSDVGIDEVMLYKYLNNQTLDTGFVAKSVEDEMYEIQFAKRKIKLIHPRLIGKIYDEFKVLLQSKIARGTTSIITLTT